MKLSCLQENLAKGLAVVSRAVSTRSVLPVLHNVLLATDQGQLKLSATDLSTSITCWIGAKIGDEGAITIPARLLVEFVNGLPSETVELEFIARTQTLHLRCARTEANIKGIDAQEFPLIPSASADPAGESVTQRLSVDSEAFCRMIAQVTFAAATDESRPILTGALADFKDGRLILAAADGFRLSVRSASLPDAASSAERRAVIVPARALQELSRIAAGQEEPLEVLMPPKGNQILFRLSSSELGGPIELVSQLIEGNFPDYQQIIPKTHTTRTVIGTQDFLRAAKIALLFARDAANIVRLQMVPAEGRLIVAATAAEVGDDRSELDATVEGEPLEIAFNGRYLIEILNVISSPQVVLETNTASSPGVFRPVDGEDFVHVIMPMHISR